MKVQALVARNLRRLRVQNGLSQEGLAVDSGVDRSYMSRLERGLENPTIAMLDKIATTLKVEIVEFFVVPPKGEPPPKPLPGGRRSNR
jgi:transcriptional regulator with XRE-family HTH domain